MPLDIMPVGLPCFVPGRSSRVVFAGGDGHLCRLEFDDEHEARSPRGDESTRPLQVKWRSDLAGSEPFSIMDPFWPTDPRLGGCLVAALDQEGETDAGQPHRRSELWWLRLDAEASEVIDAGPLHGSASRAGYDESLPDLAVSADGRPIAVYLSKRQGEKGWSLRAAPIELDPRRGSVRMDRARGVLLAGYRMHTLPVLSADARWVYSLPFSARTPERAERTPLPAIGPSPRAAGTRLFSGMPGPPWH